MASQLPGSESPSSSSPPSPSGREEAAALIRTIQMTAAEKARTQKNGKGPGRRSPILYILLLLAAAGNAYLWIGRPAWLVGDRATAAPPEEQEGVLRFRMYVQAQRIESYRIERGSLPDRLEDTGVPYEGMQYRRTGPASWELMGTLGGASLLLRSSQSINDFLGGTGEAQGATGP